MKIFKTIQGLPVDVVEHTLEVLKTYPISDIHIGTDSQNLRNKTVYVTVIAFRYGIRGAHYLLYKEIVPKIKDNWSRLFKETELSLEVADWFTSKIKVPVQIDMDYNEDINFEISNRLIPACKGWAVSLGYDVNCKSGEQIATKAADHHCRTVKVPRRRKKK